MWQKVMVIVLLWGIEVACGSRKPFSTDRAPERKTYPERNFVVKKVHKSGAAAPKKREGWRKQKSTSPTHQDVFKIKKQKEKLSIQTDAFAKRKNTKKYITGEDAFKSAKISKRKSSYTGDAFLQRIDRKEYGDKAMGKRVRVPRSSQKGSSPGDAFVTHKKVKEYGQKAMGKKVKWKRRERQGEMVGAGNFTAATGNYMMNYGEKAWGKKPKKKIVRQLKRKEDRTDAFAVVVKLDKHSPYAGTKGKPHRSEAGTGKKKKFSLPNIRKWFKTKEERRMRRRQKEESDPFNNDTRFVKKEMKKQKKKKEYGLGLPSYYK